MIISLIIFYIIVSTFILAVVGINVKNLYHHSCEGKMGIPMATLFMIIAIILVILGAISLASLIHSF